MTTQIEQSLFKNNILEKCLENIPDCIQVCREKMDDKSDFMLELMQISDVILECELRDLSSATVKQLIELIIDQTTEHTEFPMFNALEKIVGLSNFPSESALRITSYIFECNDLQEYQDKPTRLSGIRTIKKLMFKGGQAFLDQGKRLINGYIKATTGEKNPEVLLENFVLAKQMLLLTGVRDAAIIDELFNSLCIYFPIRFAGTTSHDKLIGKQLDEALKEVLVCSKEFASLLGVFIIEKLQDSDETYKDKVDICILLETFLAQKYDSKVFAPYIREILDGLRTMSMDPRHKGDITEACNTISKMIIPLMEADRYAKGVYEAIGKHNYDNTEPFLVRPEIGFVEKAMFTLTPFALNKQETSVRQTVLHNVLRTLFNNIHSATLIEYAAESLMLAEKWIDQVNDAVSQKEMLKATKNERERAFNRIEQEFETLNVKYMHILAKMKYLENGEITYDEIRNYITSSFMAKDIVAARNSCIIFAQNLPKNAKAELNTVLNDILKKVPYSSFPNYFINHLGCAAITNANEFEVMKSSAFAYFGKDNCITIIKFFLEAKKASCRKYDEISLKIIDQLLSNFDLKKRGELVGEEEKIVELTELIFELAEDIDISKLLKQQDNLEGFPYLALLAIKATATGKLKTPISHWYKLWASVDPKLEMCLRYASFVQGETELQSIKSDDVISLKKHALEQNNSSCNFVAEFLEKQNGEKISYDVLFDFHSAWFNHELLGLKSPKNYGMSCGEFFVVQVYDSFLNYIENHMDSLEKFTDAFVFAIRLIESIPNPISDMDAYYLKTLELVMTSLAKEENLCSSENAKLLPLLPNLAKRVAKNTNVKEMVETILKVVNQNADLASAKIALTTLEGLVESFPALVVDQDLMRKIYKAVDCQTICENRSVRNIASKLRTKFYKLF